MLPEKLQRILMFASALQVLGDDHQIARNLERAVRHGDDRAWQMATLKIDDLPKDQRLSLNQRFAQLCQQLPQEAFAA